MRWFLTLAILVSVFACSCLPEPKSTLFPYVKYGNYEWRLDDTFLAFEMEVNDYIWRINNCQDSQDPGGSWRIIMNNDGVFIQDKSYLGEDGEPAASKKIKITRAEYVRILKRIKKDRKSVV